MCEAQIDRERQDVHAERCTRLQALGHSCRLTWSQHGQCPAYRSTQVTTGRTGGRSTLSYRSCSPDRHRSAQFRQCTQLSALATTVASGLRASSRRTLPGPSYPGAGRCASFLRLILSLRRRQARIVGVFGGSASFASNSAMRRSASSSRCHSARINVSFSAWLS